MFLLNFNGNAQSSTSPGQGSGMFVLGFIFHPFILTPLETKCIEVLSAEMSDDGGTMGIFPQAGLAAWRQKNWELNPWGFWRFCFRDENQTFVQRNWPHPFVCALKSSEINFNTIFASWLCSERHRWFIFQTNNLQLGSASVNCSHRAPG